MKMIASITLMGLLAIAGCASRPADAKTATAAAPSLDSNLPKLASIAGDAEPASDVAQPSTAPAMPGLPQGHPDLSKLMGGQPPATQPSGTPQLPKGHPDISKLSGGEQQTQEQPAGTPQLPKGHPDISKLRASSTQPTAGTLNVRAVQGTAGAPPVGADPIIVEVYGNDQLIGKLDIKLDDD